VKVAFRVGGRTGGEMKEFVRERRQGEEKETRGKRETDRHRRQEDDDEDRKEGTATRDAPATSRRRRDRMRNFDASMLGARFGDRKRGTISRVAKILHGCKQGN